MPGIRDEVQQLPPGERGQRKALRLAEAARPRLPLTWTFGQGQARTQARITDAAFEGTALVLRVEAQRGGWRYVDEVVVVNPPIMVPTGRMVPNPAPDADAAAMVHEYEEDAEGAIRAVVEDVIRIWQGVER